MSVFQRILVAVALIAGLFATTAQRPASALTPEDVLFEIVAYYNPTLAEAQPLVHCVITGAAVDSCAQQFLQGAALEDPNIQRMLQVMDAYNRDAYAEVISLAGVGVACAWIDNPPVICSQFAQVVVDIGAEAINAQIAVTSAVAELFVDAAASVGCWTGVYCDDDAAPANQYDAAAEWQRCFQSRVEEGLVLRLSGGNRWANFIRRQPSSHLFAARSVLGECYPFASQAELQLTSVAVIHALHAAQSSPPAPLPGGQPFSNGWDQANPWATLPDTISQPDATRMLSDFVAYSSAPLSDQFEKLIEDAAQSAIDEAAQDYSNVQTNWTARPDPQARQALVALLTNTNPIQPGIPYYAASQLASCMQTFDTPEAHMIDRWADSGARANSSRSVRTINASNWAERRPVAWCNNYYVASFTQILTARKAAYDAALARGCTRIGGRTPNPLMLQCPALGGGLQRCHGALDGVQGAQCTLIPLVFRPVPQQPVTDATDSPPTVTTTAPPQASEPELRSTVRRPILTPPATTTVPQPQPQPQPQRDTPG